MISYRAVCGVLSVKVYLAISYFPVFEGETETASFTIEADRLE